MASFAALDFETADPGRDSACSVALVRVERGRIAAEQVRLIRPPRRSFTFTGIHGIRWADVANEPLFPEVFAALSPLLRDVSFVAAHNASFERSVLAACCGRYGLRLPGLSFLCTVALARRRWGIRPTRLPDVCSHLGIPLGHHDPLSDARACAQIVLRAGPGALGLSPRVSR